MKLLKKVFPLLWQAGIYICCVALFVGLVSSLLMRHYGERDALNPEFVREETETAADEPSAPPAVSADSNHHELLELAATADCGDEYFGLITFCADSSMRALRQNSLVSASRIWTGSNGVISGADCAEEKIIYPGDGSEMTVAEAAAKARPALLYLCIGRDGLSGANEQSFKSSYRTLIEDIQKACPSTCIVCCNAIPVTASYSGADSLSNGRILDLNGWLKELCTETGIFYLDIASCVSKSSVLNPDYAAADGASLNAAGISEVIACIRTHRIP